MFRNSLNGQTQSMLSLVFLTKGVNNDYCNDLQENEESCHTTKDGSEITDVNIGTYNVEQVNEAKFDNIVAEFKKNPEPTVENYYWVTKEN